MDQQINQNNVINKKYLVIVFSVIITALIVGVGVFMWQQSISNRIKNSALQERQLLEQQIQSLQKQLLELQSKDNQGLNTSNNENEKESEQVNTISGNNIKIEITNGTKYCSHADYPEIGYQKILKAIYSNKTEKILYSTSKTKQSEQSELDCLSSEGICCPKLSPDEKYLIFSKTGWEWSKPYMINIGSGKYVFGDDTEIKDIYIVKEIKWSSNSNNFALTTDVDEMGGVGEMGIYVSAYNNPDKIQKIWSAQNYLLTEIKNINFVENDKLRIEIEQSDKENSPRKSTNYEYDFKQDRLVVAN